MISYDIEVYTRETCFHYSEFDSIENIELFLLELKEGNMDLQDYIFSNLDECGLEYEETYYISVTNGKEEIDRFDPTKEIKAENIRRDLWEYFPENRGNKRTCQGYLYFFQALKSLYSGKLVLDEPYQREKMTIDLDVHKIYRADEDGSDPDVFEHTTFNYSGDPIELEVNPVDGRLVIKFVLFDDTGDKIEFDAYGGVDEILDQLLPYLS